MQSAAQRQRPSAIVTSLVKLAVREGGGTRGMASEQQNRYMNDERVLLVDENDKVLGTATKREAHHRSTMRLHRAFSVFAFTGDGKLLMQRRAATKITFPSLWTNTVCSHPLSTPAEMDETEAVGVRRAAVRKIAHELGLEGVRSDELTLHGRYLYRAEMGPQEEWGEHELDYALVLRNVQPEGVHPNLDEVSETRLVDRAQLDEWIRKDPNVFTPWFSLFVAGGHLARWWRNLDGLEKSTAIVHMSH